MLKEITQKQYLAIPKFSNADLSDYKSFIKNGYHPLKDFSKVFCLGDLIYKVILHTNTFTSTDQKSLNTTESLLLDKLFTKVSEEIPWLLDWKTEQHIYEWRDKESKMYCKSQIDVNLSNNTIVIFKTTSAKNLAVFLEAADKYDYDRQAAFEKNVFDSYHKADSKVLFVVLSKVYPFNLMTYEPTKEMIDRGIEKYKALLMDINKHAYIPSHWPNDFNKDYPF